MASGLDVASVERLVARAAEGSPPSLDETAALVSLTPGPAAEALLEGAAAIREREFGRKVFLYGFVYISTFCRNNCRFCNDRSELTVERYRKSPDEILKAASNLAESGVHLIDLTMGEDERYLDEPGFEDLLGLVRAVASTTGLPVMLSPGLLSGDRLAAAKAAGADWYALYQETHDRGLFELWRRGQDYDERMAAKLDALAAGLLVEEGILLGAGAPPDSLARSIAQMRALGARQVRAMTYVPSPGGLPPAPAPSGILQELLTIAALRLSMPGALIPASLDVEGLRGLEPRVRAGANVITSLVPAGSGLAGVANRNLDIDSGDRGPVRAAERLRAMGLSAARPSDYRDWLKGAKGRLAASR
jgi:methylornithine synthase